MEIYFEEGQVVSEDILEKMEKAAVYAVQSEAVDELDAERCEVSVTFVETEEIRQLNREYRNVDRVTDVLSFPQFADLEEVPEVGEICLGDVVICGRVARRQAEEYGHSYERELLYLFVHSILHLLGYDHMEEEEKRQMRIREEYVMEKIGLTR